MSCALNRIATCTLPLIFASLLSGGTSGKIVGRVTDIESGEPLIGCNVIVIGTSLGAATDLQGEYAILNVPPGKYDLKAVMIGYTPVTLKSVEVAVDLTSRVDFQMGMEVIAGEEVTVVAAKPIVRLDQTSMASVLGAEDIKNLPVVEVGELVELQAGVVRDPGGGLHVRGGRSGEVSFWVDGISTTDVYDGTMGFEIENNSIQELQVISGTFNAEYGNAMSAVVNIVTKEGGEKLTGGFDIYGGGYHTFDERLFTLSSPFELWQPYDDLNGNGKWDRGEWWQDRNNNFEWDPGEPFVDEDGDGIWDEGEPLHSDVGLDGMPGDPLDNGSKVPSRFSDNDGVRNEASFGEGDGNAQWGEHEFSLDNGGYLDKLNIFMNPLQIKNLQFYLSGPVPLFSQSLTFYANFRYFNTRKWFYGKRLFTPLGTFGDGKVVPMAPFAKMTSQLKLTFRPVSRFKIGYSLFYDEKSYRTLNSFGTTDLEEYFFKYNPDGVLNKFEEDISHIISVTHTLSPRTYYEVKLIDFSSSYWEYLFSDPGDTPFETMRAGEKPVSSDSVTISTLYGDVTVPRYFIVDSSLTVTSGGDSAWEYTYWDAGDTRGYVDPVILITPAWSFAPGGTQGGRFERNTSYNAVRFDLSSQVNKHNQTKLGFELKKYDLWADEKSVQYGTLGDWGITAHGDTIGFNPLAGSRTESYVPTILPPYTTDHNYFRKRPIEFSAYIQDKLEFDDLIVNFGLRYDFFDADGAIPEDDRFPGNRKFYLASTSRDTIIFWEHDYPQLHDAVTIIDSLDAEGAVKGNTLLSEESGNASAWDELRTDYRWHPGYRKAPVSFQLSPRLGISYPITDKGAIHVSYGHFFQIPNFSFLYANPEFEVSDSKFGGILGNAALKPERTVMYEVGLKQEIAPFTSFDFTLFYRDTRDWVGIGPPIDRYPVGTYYKYENKDYANTRGFTMTINRAPLRGIGGSLYYSWMVAEGTYSNPSDAYFDAQNEVAPRISLVPLNWDQTNTLNGSVTMSGKSWTMALIGEFWSGKPYTPEFKVGQISGTGAFSGFAENSDRRPDYLNVDLRASYNLRLLGLNAILYANIYNLFDIRNELIVWRDTGRATYTLTARDVPETDISRIGTLHEHLNRPDWFSEPRKINVGLNLSF